MQNELFDDIPVEVKRAIITQQLVQPIKNTLYRLRIQRRAAEITSDEEGLKAIIADEKRLASQLAVFEDEFEQLTKSAEVKA